MRKIPKILCVVPAVNAPFVINILQPLNILKSRNILAFTVVKEKYASVYDVLGHDVVFFFRNFSPELIKLLHFSRLSGKPVIYAVDDNFFELEHSEKKPLSQAQLDAHSGYIVNADLVMVYSDLMVERASRYNEKIMKMAPGGIFFSILDRLKKRTRDKKIRIIYATSRYKNDILYKLFLPALKKILLEYPGLVEMEFWGFRPQEEELRGLSGVKFRKPMDYGKYIRRLYAENFDIGLAPLKDDLFHRSKTNTKFRDYGACGIACIYSDVDVYSDIEDGKTGLFVRNNDDAWYGALKRLIEDVRLRESIKKNAYEFVKTNYDIKVAADKLYEALSELIDRKGDEKARIPLKNRLAAQFLDLKDIPEEGRAPAYCLSLKVFHGRLQFLSELLFKKTRLNRIERFFRKSILNPVRVFFRTRTSG